MRLTGAERDLLALLAGSRSGRVSVPLSRVTVRATCEYLCDRGLLEACGVRDEPGYAITDAGRVVAGGRIVVPPLDSPRP